MVIYNILCKITKKKTYCNVNLFKIKFLLLFTIYNKHPILKKKMLVLGLWHLRVYYRVYEDFKIKPSVSGDNEKEKFREEILHIV